MSNATLSELILRAHKLLDPNRQGLAWPDPIAWDGRPLVDQACDLRTMLDVRDGECATHQNPYREMIDLLGTAIVDSAE